MTGELLSNEADLISAIQARLEGPVAVLHGGWSSERDVSISSGKAVHQGLRNAGLETELIDVDRDIAEVLSTRGIRHVFNALHGPFGEDGVLQSLLQMQNISCTGSGVLASALAMDKIKSKQLWCGVDVATPAFAVHRNDQGLADSLQALGGEVFVKPANEGSSIGMARAKTVRALQQAFEQAQGFDSEVLLEQTIHGPEYTVAIVSGQILPTLRLQPARDFYDYEAKYLVDTTEYLCPCGLSAEEEAQLGELAYRAYETLGCSGWGRVDVMRDDSNGEFYVLEVNTVPGMTDHSLVPMAAKAAGIGFSALVLNILLASLGGSEGEAG
jgi:D-alanine-D-alanine ligase